MSPICRSGAAEIDLQVVFGSPSRACVGTGVCKMLPKLFTPPAEWSCRAWPGKLRYSEEGNLMLSFSFEQFSSAEIAKWFSGDRFLLEEEFQLPLWLCSQLKKTRLALPKGGYAYTTQQLITITFKREDLVHPRISSSLPKSRFA